MGREYGAIDLPIWSVYFDLVYVTLVTNWKKLLLLTQGRLRGLLAGGGDPVPVVGMGHTTPGPVAATPRQVGHGRIFGCFCPQSEPLRAGLMPGSCDSAGIHFLLLETGSVSPWGITCPCLSPESQVEPDGPWL